MSIPRSRKYSTRVDSETHRWGLDIPHASRGPFSSWKDTPTSEPTLRPLPYRENFRWTPNTGTLSVRPDPGPGRAESVGAVRTSTLLGKKDQVSEDKNLGTSLGPFSTRHTRPRPG